MIAIVTQEHPLYCPMGGCPDGGCAGEGKDHAEERGETTQQGLLASEPKGVSYALGRPREALS